MIWRLVFHLRYFNHFNSRCTYTLSLTFLLFFKDLDFLSWHWHFITFNWTLLIYWPELITLDGQVRYFKRWNIERCTGPSWKLKVLEDAFGFKNVFLCRIMLFLIRLSDNLKVILRNQVYVRILRPSALWPHVIISD